MAMVHQRTEDELTNLNETEDDSHLSEERSEAPSSRSSSRNSNRSKRSSPCSLPQYQYSKDELMELSKAPLAKKRPECLDIAHNNTSGKWDPEKWFVNKRGDKPTLVEETRPKRERQDVDIPLGHKKRSSDPRERVKEEKDEIILSPQRRSFGTGCHVIQHAFAKRPGSPTDIRDGDSFRENTRRIGSGRIMSRDREQRDWDLDHRDYRSSGRNDRRDRFDQDDNDKDVRRYSNRYGRGERRMRGHERIEEEPEWFSSGPTSQSETIELVGFEDASGEGDVKRTSKKASKKNKDASRRQSLKSEEEVKPEPVHVSEARSEKGSQPKTEAKVQSSKKPESPSLPNSNGIETSKPSNNSNFDLEDLFRMDWIPGLLPNENPPENASNEIGCSRFTQWFQRESPVLDNQGSGGNSRRSSFHEELLAHVFSGIGEPQLLIPSPTPSSESYFTPISPALHHSPTCSIMPPHPADDESSKSILEMLQSSSDKIGVVNGEKPGISVPSQDTKSIKELEADLKRIVLGGSSGQQSQQDVSAFDKLLQHMSDATPSSISMGPMDKSKALQEEDLLQNIMGERLNSPGQVLQNDKNFLTDKSGGGLGISNHVQPPGHLSHDLFNKRMQEQQQAKQQFAEQMSRMFMMQQNQPDKNVMPPRFTIDTGKAVEPPPYLSPNSLSPGMHMDGPPFNRNDLHPFNAMLQQHRQREIVSSIVKQQHQIAQLPQNQQSLMHPMKCPSTKDFVGSAPQTLGLPPLASGTSPRQSPLPPDSHGSAVHQGRIPSPLVFGQQPPALSHAPAPIHPTHVAQAVAQNSSNSNTLQVQNSMVMQRVPSPQELAVHTQTILQNALIKRKLEEQKENFRKRQEAQRTNSPVVLKTGSTSPLKGMSPTIAFTPTSVMRKMHSEKVDAPQQKNNAVQAGMNKSMGLSDCRPMEQMLNASKHNFVAATASASDFAFSACSSLPSKSGNSSVPRPVYGQSMVNPVRGQQSVAMNNNAMTNMNSYNAMNMNPSQGQGRPIVKGGNGHMLVNPLSGNAIRVAPSPNKPVAANKLFSSVNNQYPSVHAERGSNTAAVNKFLEQQRLLQQKSVLEQCRQSTSPMPPVHTAAAAATFTFGPRGHTINPPVVRPVNLPPPTAVAAAPNINIPLLRTLMQTNTATAVRAQTCSLGQLRTLGQLAALQQMQQQLGVGDSNQISNPARNYHPLMFQQLLLNSQNQVAAQAQAVAGIAGAHGDGKHAHLMPCQTTTNRQSPVNLTKWFGNDVLKQKMPEMPPVSHQKALRLEDVERQQQHSTVVHN